MIIITSLSRSVISVSPGDSFRLKVSVKTIGETTGRVVEHDTIFIEETITVAKTIDFVASFRFALDDGTCTGFHLAGFFGNSSELPKEMQDAVLIEDLPPEKLKRFKETMGALLDKALSPPPLPIIP